MSVSLLSTKIHIPPLRPNGISRPRLTERLLAGPKRPGSFVLLSGPAGFGKTTLLSEFVVEYQRPVAWVSLDEVDNDPSRFWTYLIAACQSIQHDIGESAWALLQTPQQLPDETIPTVLINDIHRSETDFVLVLDDFHTIQNQSIHKALSFLLDHIPDNLHLVLSTRVDPPWPLARLRARNQLIEIRTADLRFTTEETAAFLNQVMGLKLSAEDVAALEARTEGWIASLQLAAISMRERKDVADFIKAFTGSHVYVAEYLIEEVLGHQLEEVKTFLLQTSILERLHASLCEAVSQRPDGQSMLKNLYQANLFLLPLDDERQWFRYHHLFADLLRARLQQTVSSEEIAVLHHHAAIWYEQHEFIAEAVHHRLAARDFHEAARLIGQSANQMLTRGELATLIEWIKALPADVIPLHPQIIMAKVWALTLVGAVREVEPLLQLAEAQIEVGGETPVTRELAGFAAAIRAFFAMMAGDHPRALELAERAELLLPESSVHARWLLPYTLGAAYRGQGQYEKAVEAFARQVQMGEMYNNLIVWGTGITGIAIVRRLQGRLREAADTCLQGLQRLVEQGAIQFGSLAKLEVPLVEVLCEKNELEEAHQRLTGVIARMQNWTMPTDQLHAFLALMQLQHTQGDLRGAFETLHTAKDLKAQHSVIRNLARSVDLYEIRLYLQTGEIAEADRLMDMLNPGTSFSVESREQELIMLARLRLAQGKPDEAEQILSPLIKDAEAGEGEYALIEMLALQVCALNAKSDNEAAVEVLLRALTLAEPEGFVRIFVDEGERMQQLLVAVLHKMGTSSRQASQPSKTYIINLLDAFPGTPKSQVSPHSGDKVTGLVEQLTPRELEVLQLIAAGDSNQTIANKLVITLRAVKKHTGNIFGKLNVNSRTQAIARARQLELLSPDN
jgi:LuxR family transcriptional regulator, maltose regulon positive regulatory protein